MISLLFNLITFWRVILLCMQQVAMTTKNDPPLVNDQGNSPLLPDGRLILCYSSGLISSCMCHPSYRRASGDLRRRRHLRPTFSSGLRQTCMVSSSSVDGISPLFILMMVSRAFFFIGCLTRPLRSLSSPLPRGHRALLRSPSRTCPCPSGPSPPR